MTKHSSDAWWCGPQAPRTFPTFVSMVHGVLHRATTRHGWVNKDGAERMLGREAWAAVSRFLGSWEDVCRRSTPSGLMEEAERLAEHLWAVRHGDRGSLGAVDSRKDAVRHGMQSGKFLGRIQQPQSTEPAEQIVTGKTLALILAHILEGDGEMTPVAEARHIQIRAYDAVIITQEVLETWKRTEGVSKVSFRRILARRLREGRTKSFARESGLTPLSAAKFSGA